MAIGAPNAGTNTGFTAATTSAVPFPTTTRSGNYLTLGISFGSANTSCTTPAGWTLLGTLGGTGGTLLPTLFVYGKYADGTEGGTSLTVTHASTVNRAQIVEWPSVHPTTAMDVALVSVDSSTASVNCIIPSITPVTAGATLVTFSTSNGATDTATPPTNFTEIGDGGTTRSLEIAYLQNVAAAASGTATVVWPSGKQVGIMVALRPAADVPFFSRAVRRLRPPVRRSKTTAQVFTTTVVVTTQALPPQPKRDARGGWRQRRRPRGAQVIQTQAVVTAPLPAQPVRRLLRVPIRPRRTATFVPPVTVTVTTQALPPQRGRRLFAPVSRPRGRSTTVPPVVQTLPPQQGRRSLVPLSRRRGRSTFVPTTTVTVTTQALPPQQGRRLVPPILPRRVSRNRIVLSTTVVTTTQALPPQPGRRFLAPILPRRQRATRISLTQVVTVTTQPLPPQPGRRRTVPVTPRRRRRTAVEFFTSIVQVVTTTRGSIKLGNHPTSTIKPGTRTGGGMTAGTRSTPTMRPLDTSGVTYDAAVAYDAPVPYDGAPEPTIKPAPRQGPTMKGTT